MPGFPRWHPFCYGTGMLRKTHGNTVGWSIPRYCAAALLWMSAWGLAVPARVDAKPPAGGGFMRADALQEALAARLKELKAQEEFNAKPIQEQHVILLKRGENDADGHAVEAADVVEELFKWKELRAATPSEAAARAAALLPEALGTRYGNLDPKSRSELRERYKAAKELVAALNDKHFRIRQIAIDCLAAVYGETRGYQAMASEAERKRIQKKWSKAIRR